jgi:hypothetical protein
MVSPSVELLDGFAGHADGLRSAGLASSYKRLALEAPGGEEITSDLIAPAPLGPSQAVVTGISERLGARFRLLSASFRVEECSAGRGENWHIAGGNPLDTELHLAVLGLSESDDQAARSCPHNWPGLAFWRYGASGAVHGAEDVPIDDRFVHTAWSMQGLVRLVPDRLVLTPATAFLSLWPGTATPLIGDDPNPLIWAAYVRRE